MHRHLLLPYLLTIRHPRDSLGIDVQKFPADQVLPSKACHTAVGIIDIQISRIYHIGCRGIKDQRKYRKGYRYVLIKIKRRDIPRYRFFHLLRSDTCFSMCLYSSCIEQQKPDICNTHGCTDVCIEECTDGCIDGCMRTMASISVGNTYIVTQYINLHALFFFFRIHSRTRDVSFSFMRCSHRKEYFVSCGSYAILIHISLLFTGECPET